MAVNVYLNFNGICREAVEFYSKVFGTEQPQIMTFGDVPSGDYPLSEEDKQLVLHSRLIIKDTIIMFSDAHPTSPVVVGDNISLSINSTDMDEIKSLYNTLKEGGKVSMELQETFWSKCYGYVFDKFGIGWHLTYETAH